MLILQRRLSGTEMKDSGIFSGLERQNYTLYRKGRMLQRTRRVKKQLTNLQSIVRSSKMLEGTAKQDKISEKGKFAWTLGAHLEEGISEIGKQRSHISNITKVLRARLSSGLQSQH